MKSTLKLWAKTLLYKSGYVLLQSAPKLGRGRRIPVHQEDYIRSSSLEFAAEEIYSSGLQGHVAELGVYQGEFAKWINQAFPDRKLYLFDTFEGFDHRDAKIDRELGYSTANEQFATSVDLVLSKMRYPNNCVVKKGWFPESADGIKENFCFVSIDVDLYPAIISGLEFFYPLLVKGGYVFVHDYNNIGYKGVKPAVREFCISSSIGFFPLSDGSGSAVIVK